MAKFRKKPVVVEAHQWRKQDRHPCGFNGADWPNWLKAAYAENILHRARLVDGARYWMIETLEGPMRVEVGDWIICGVKGELYLCKPDIFELTYESAHD